MPYRTAARALSSLLRSQCRSYLFTQAQTDGLRLGHPSLQRHHDLTGPKHVSVEDKDQASSGGRYLVTKMGNHRTVFCVDTFDPPCLYRVNTNFFAASSEGAELR